MTQQYTEDDIKVLTDRDHVRLRLPVYAGATTFHTYDVPIFTDLGIDIKSLSFCPATYKCLGEIIDNSIDEHSQINLPNKTIDIQADTQTGTYTISDNGRGVPIGIHETGKHVPEIVFNSLRSGRNFKDDKAVGVIGMNGMGSAITCFCSTSFEVDIHRDNKHYTQTFFDGGLNTSKPIIKNHKSKQTGTSIKFKLDSEVFTDITLPTELVRNRAIEIALTNPDITTSFNTEKFKFKKGFEEIVSKVSTNYFKFETTNIEFYVVFDFHTDIDEKIFTWVNSSFLFDGGICNTQFTNAFYDKTIEFLTKKSKKKEIVTKNDVRRGLLILGNIKVSDPQYDAQSKTRLTGPSLRKEMDEAVNSLWSTFTKKNKQWLEDVLERALARHNLKADKKAVDDHKKKLTKKIPGLIDATSSNRYECQLILTEGDSASASITDARDPKTTGVLPARGKPNNVYGCSVAELLSMQKISDIISAIGLVPGKKAIRSELRYGRVVFATDADVDGGDIFTLFVNLFYHYWPELFDPKYPPFIHRLVAPNICLVKGNVRKHFSTRKEFEKHQDKYKGWTTIYYKGLGSMVRADWEMILSEKTDTTIPIVDDNKLESTLKLLFSNDVEARKQWLQN